jgi:hypothetical protein
MLLTLFNIFNLVSYKFYLVVIFEFYMVKIYGPDLDQHGSMNTRRVLEPVIQALGSVWFQSIVEWNRSILVLRLFGPNQSGTEPL